MSLSSDTTTSGTILDAGAMLVELDNAGRLLYAFPDSEAGGPAPTMPPPVAPGIPRRPKRPPRPGSMRELVRAVLTDAGEWLSASDVAERAPQVLGRPLKRRSVYNALVRGGVRRWEKDGAVLYRVV